MLGVILTGHGSFATGLYQAVVQIIGKQEQFSAIDFPDGMSIESLEQQLRDALNQCNTSDGVIILADLLGGSPFRTAAMLSYEFPNVDVIAGTNMPLALEMLLQRDYFDRESFRNKVIIDGQHGITSLWHENQKKPTQQEESLDGI